MMKIGIDYRMGGNIHAGIGRYISQLLKALLVVDTENQYVVFYNPKACDQAEIEELRKNPRVTLGQAPFRHYSVSEQLRFLKVLNKHEVDLMHFPNFNVPVMYKKPFVVTIHDLVHHKISGHKKSRYLKFLAYKKIIESAAKNSKSIITVSEAAKKDILKVLGVPEQKVEVVYEGYSLVPASEEDLQEVKKSYGLKRPYFLFVGTLERKKNVVTLARAFNLFLEKYNLDMDLVIAGKVDSHYPEIKDQALQIKNKDRLLFTGFVDDHELSALYAGAHAFVSASLHEGFGLPGVEALSFGLPLLVSNSEVFNEVYDSAAIYFNPEDEADIAEKMRLVVQDMQFYEQMRVKSLARAEFFSWEEAAKKTLEIYENSAN